MIDMKQTQMTGNPEKNLFRTGVSRCPLRWMLALLCLACVLTVPAFASDFSLVNGTVSYQPPITDTSPGSGFYTSLSADSIGNDLPYGTVYIDYDSMDMRNFPNIPAYPTTSPGTTANPVDLSSEQCLSYTGTNNNNPDVTMTVTIHDTDFTLCQAYDTQNLYLDRVGIHYMPKPNDATRRYSTNTNLAGGRTSLVLKAGEIVTHPGKIATVHFTNVAYLSDGSVADLEVTISNSWLRNTLVPTKNNSGTINNDMCYEIVNYLYSGNYILPAACGSNTSTWGVNAARIEGAFDFEMKVVPRVGSAQDLTGKTFLFGLKDYDICSRSMFRDVFWIDYLDANGNRVPQKDRQGNVINAGTPFDLIGRKMNDAYNNDTKENNLFIPAFTGEALTDANDVTYNLWKQNGSSFTTATDGDRYKIDGWHPGDGGWVKQATLGSAYNASANSGTSGSNFMVPSANTRPNADATIGAQTKFFFSVPITDPAERIPLYDRTGTNRYYFAVDPTSDQFKTETGSRLTTDRTKAFDYDPSDPDSGTFAYPLYKSAVFENSTGHFMFWMLSMDEFVTESAVLYPTTDDDQPRIASDILLTDNTSLYVQGTTIYPTSIDYTPTPDVGETYEDGTLDSGYLMVINAGNGVKFRARSGGQAQSMLTESGMFNRITSKTYGGGEISTSDTDIQGLQTAYEVKTPSALGLDASSRAVLAVARGKICTYTMTPETFYHAKRIQISSVMPADEADTNTALEGSTSTGAVGSFATGKGASMVNFLLDQAFDTRYQDYDTSAISGWTTVSEPASDCFGNEYYRQSATISDPVTGSQVTVYMDKMEETTIDPPYLEGIFDVNRIEENEWTPVTAVDSAGNPYTRYTYEILDPSTGEHLGTVTRDKVDKVFFQHPDNDYLYCPDSSDGSAVYAMEAWSSTAASGGIVTEAKEITYYISRDAAGIFTCVFEQGMDSAPNSGVQHDWWITVWWEQDPVSETVQIVKKWVDDGNAYHSRPEPAVAPVACVTREDGCKFAVIPPTEDSYPAASAVSSHFPADRSAWSEPIDGYQYYTVPIHGWIIRRQAGDTHNTTAAFYNPASAANLPAASSSVWTGANSQTVKVAENNGVDVNEYYYLNDLSGQGPDQGWGFVYKKDRNGLVSYEGKIQGVTLVDQEPQGSAEWIPDGLDRWRYTFEVNPIDYSAGNGYPNGEIVTYLNGNSEDNQNGQYFRITEEAVTDYHGDYADMHWDASSKRWVLHAGDDIDNDGVSDTTNGENAQYLDLLTYIEQVGFGENGVYDDFANVTGHNNHVNIPAVLQAMGNNYDFYDNTTGLYFERNTVTENGITYTVIIFDDEQIVPDPMIPGHLGNPNGSGYLVEVWLDPSGKEYRRVFTAPMVGMNQRLARYTMDILALKEDPRDTNAFMVDHGSQTAEFVIIQDENGVVNYVHPTKGFRVERDPSGDIRYYAWREAKTLVSETDGTKRWQNGVLENGQWVREANELLFFTHYASTNSSMYRGEITNTLQRGDLEFYKTDQYGNPLQGGEFTLFSVPPCAEHHHQDQDRAGYWTYVTNENTGTVSREFVTYAPAVSDADGKVTFTGLNCGVYYMLETQSPDGADVALIDDPERPGETVTQAYRVTIHEVDGTSTIEPVLISSDSSGQHMVRAQLARNDSGDLVFGADGQLATFGLLRPAYRASGEPILPAYQKDQTGALVLDENGDPIPMLPLSSDGTIYLADEKGDLVLNESGKAIPVSIAYDRDSQGKLILDEKGDPAYPSVNGKTYYLRDSSGSPLFDSEGRAIPVPTRYIIENDYQSDATLTVILWNTDMEDRPLEGGTFSLYRVDPASGENLPVEAYTDFTVTSLEGESGRFQISGLEPGDYLLRQLTAPDGYENSEPDKTFRLAYGEGEEPLVIQIKNSETIPVEPFAIVKQPENVTVAPGEVAVTTVEATGDGLSYQWYTKNSNQTRFYKSSVTDAVYSVTATEKMSGRQLYCVITDAAGDTLTTDTVTITVEKPAAGLTIVKQPESVTVAPSETALVTVEAVGAEPLSYQWYTKNSNQTRFYKSSVTDGVYSVTATEKISGRQLYCVITDAAGDTLTTDTVTITVEKPAAGLTIVKQPESVTVAPSETALVTVEAVGAEPLSYQWYTKNSNQSRFYKSSVTQPTYSVAATAKMSGRQLYCVITDAAGASVSTDTVTLTVTP